MDAKTPQPAAHARPSLGSTTIGVHNARTRTSCGREHPPKPCCVVGAACARGLRTSGTHRTRYMCRCGVTTKPVFFLSAYIAHVHAPHRVSDSQ
jgi:hypothetical protein